MCVNENDVKFCGIDIRRELKVAFAGETMMHRSYFPPYFSGSESADELHVRVVDKNPYQFAGHKSVGPCYSCFYHLLISIFD